MKKNSSIRFTSQNNINLIWDILSENDIFSKLAENKINSIKHALKEDIEIFSKSNAQENIDIMDLNKKFIFQVTNALKNKSKIKEKNNVSFEDSLEKKKYEKNRLLNLQMPEPINFEDEIIDEKNENIDELIKSVIEERKFEIKPTSVRKEYVDSKSDYLRLEDKIEKLYVLFNSFIEEHEHNRSQLLEINKIKNEYDSDTNSEITYKLEKIEI
jgi:hypothetical protein